MLSSQHTFSTVLVEVVLFIYLFIYLYIEEKENREEKRLSFTEQLTERTGFISLPVLGISPITKRIKQ